MGGDCTQEACNDEDEDGKGGIKERFLLKGGLMDYTYFCMCKKRVMTGMKGALGGGLDTKEIKVRVYVSAFSIMCLIVALGSTSLFLVCLSCLNPSFL